MSAPHSSDLDHALTAALHEADTVQIRVLDRDDNGTPTQYRAIAWHGGTGFYSSPTTTAEKAIDGALDLLRAANTKQVMEVTR